MQKPVDTKTSCHNKTQHREREGKAGTFLKKQHDAEAETGQVVREKEIQKGIVTEIQLLA